MFKIKKNFIQTSLIAAVSFFKEIIYSEELSAQPGLLQSLDPRIKLGSFIFVLIQIMVTKEIGFVFSLYCLCLLLVVFSGIRVGYFLKRTWIFMPLFSVVIALPAVLNIFSPGEILITIRVFGLTLEITKPGVFSAVLFILRVITSVSFVVLLSITTKHFELLKVLRIFGIPQIFVMTAGMCYRYIYLFAEIIENTYKAIKSRVGFVRYHVHGQHIVAWNIAFLWQRSLQLNENVYKAMLSRGYHGEAYVLKEFRIKPRDWFWCAAIIIVSLLLWFLYSPLKNERFL